MFVITTEKTRTNPATSFKSYWTITMNSAADLFDFIFSEPIYTPKTSKKSKSSLRRNSRGQFATA